MKLTHQLSSFKKSEDGTAILDLQLLDPLSKFAPEPFGSRMLRLHIYDSKYLGLRSFVANKERAGWYFGGDVTYDNHTDYLRFVGHTEYSDKMELYVFHDLCTLSRDGHLLIGGNNIVGYVETQK